MAKLGGLIREQDVAFDTHQAGDGQETNWNNVHLEKRLHGKRGKARFPLLGDAEPSKSRGMSDKDFERVKREVRDALKRNENLRDELAKTVVDELDRFSSGNATRDHAEEAARKLAGYFDLDERFLRVVEDYFGNQLAVFTTIHFNPIDFMLHEISQSGERIVIQRARRYYSLNRIQPHNK